MDIAAANTAAARALVAGLAAAGVTDCAISPGSRSTPLTVAFAEQKAVRPWLHLDERSGAYFALGLARATGRPVALVCTSGTAAANFFPAIVEANLSRVPLVVLTADRPPALRERGAAQTIDQLRIYGTHVRMALDLPLPLGFANEASQFRMHAARAAGMALGPLPGPVHLNVPFDEPLIAPPATHPGPDTRPNRGTTVGLSASVPAQAEVALAAERLAGARRPIIIAGPETGGLPGDDIAFLARRLGAPIFADGLSGLRTGPHDRSLVLDSFDAIVRDPRIAEVRADAVIHFGGPPTSKALNGMLAALRGVPYVLVDRPGGYRDPNLAADTVVSGEPAAVARILADMLEWESSTDPGWVEGWVASDAVARDVLRGHIDAFDAPFEGRVFTELQQALPAGATIVAGNSMPVRDLDSFIVASEKPLHLVANRGANGIDGVVSSALGAAAARRGPVVLVIGDISLFHDLNGLWAARRHTLDLTIVLVNNNGGGIFNYLPQASHPTLFEEWFATPTGLDFAHAAALFGAKYTVARDWDAFRAALAAGLGGGFHIVELPTDRAANVAMHQQAWKAAADAAFTIEVAPA